VRADIFKLHSLIVDDYKSYIQSFININDPEIREVVENELSKGKLWPEPLIQFNPAFETYGEVPELVSNGVLTEQLSDIFRDDKSGCDAANQIPRHLRSPYNVTLNQEPSIISASPAAWVSAEGNPRAGSSMLFPATMFLA